jgi:hypothetical protein
MERAFQWTIKNGSRILFVIAVIMFLAAIAGSFVAVSENSGAFEGESLRHANWRILLQQLLLAFQYPVLPLIGALVVYNLEKRQRS